VQLPAICRSSEWHTLSAPVTALRTSSFVNQTS